jgi:hypothetical protein
VAHLNSFEAAGHNLTKGNRRLYTGSKIEVTTAIKMMAYRFSRLWLDSHASYIGFKPNHFRYKIE